MAITGFPIIGGSSGGGSGGVVNRYAGEWDMTPSIITLSESVPAPNRSTGFLKLNDDIFQFLGDESPLTVGNSYLDGVIADGVSPVNSGVRSACALWPSISSTDNFSGLFLTIQNNTSELSDAYAMLSTSPINTINGVIFILQYDVNTNGIAITALIVKNSTPDYSTMGIFSIAAPASGTELFYEVDTATGVTSLTIDGISYSPNRVIDIADFANDTFTTSYSIVFSSPTLSVANSNSFVFDLGTTKNGRLPFLSVVAEIALPVNAADGKVYQVINTGGTYNNTYANVGDYVELADNLQKLIVISRPQTQAQIEQITQNKINANLSANGAITAAIEGAKDALSEELEIADSVTHYIDPDVGLVMLNGINGAVGVTVFLPIAQYQYRGKRLVIVSYIQSSDLNISTTQEYIYGNFPPITSVQAGDVFEFAAQPSLVNGNPVWARIK